MKKNSNGKLVANSKKENPKTARFAGRCLQSDKDLWEAVAHKNGTTLSKLIEKALNGYCMS